MRLRIATCRPLPEPDVDESLLNDALSAAGIQPVMCAWDDPAAWTGAVPTLVRSTWDYIHRLDAFRDWIKHVGRTAPLWNPAVVMRENLHKRYLLLLASRGVSIVPTMLVERGDRRPFKDLARPLEATQLVIKPAVGAGSFETHRVTSDSAEASSLWERLVSERDMLIQPYLSAVESHGERALVWIDGEFTHAVRKSPRFAADAEQVSEALPISDAERTLGEAALAPWRSMLLYARVDVAPGRDGHPVVMELELVEPSLFLKQSPRALARLVSGVRRRLVA